MRNIRNIAEAFGKDETDKIADFYVYVRRRKLIVYVPEEETEKITDAVSAAGGGVIGNYLKCSFRTKGTGTFLPDENASPYSGRKNEMNFVSEVKLEIEFDPDLTGEVVSAMLKSHVYEEPAYEIYDFKKRTDAASGIVVTLKKSMNIAGIESVIGIASDSTERAENIRRFVLIETEADEEIIDSAKFINCDHVLALINDKIKLLKI